MDAAVMSWPTPHTEFEHHHGQPIDAYRPMSQSSHPPQPTATIVPMCADAKPRLTKDQHEILEAHFRQQPKPSTSVKKGYAESLGVPLDKINNWFQNRRAKVKQEAKKAANQFQLYNTLNQHQGQYYHVQQMAPQLPFFYGPPPVVPSNTEPALEASTVPQSSLAVQNPNLLQTSTPTSGYPTQSAVVTSAPHDEMTFGPQTFVTDMPAQSMMLSDFNFGPSFQDDMLNMHETFDFMQMPESASVPASVATMSSDAMLTPSSGNQSPASMPQLTSAYMPLSVEEDAKPRFQVDSPQDMIDFSSSSGHPTPAESTTTWSSIAPSQDAYDKTNAPTPALNQHDSPESLEIFERRDSSAVTFGSPAESESTFKVPAQMPGLAARRQKPRPANLAPTAFRSASFTAGMPGSPSSTATPVSQDQLRRIRSHGVNIVSGRISKPSGPQKSPLHATFDASAVNSPKFARHASNYSVSTINSNGPLTATTMPNSLAPPTPITPNEFTRFQLGQVSGFGFPNGSPSTFSNMGEDAIYLDTSSPMGKLDMHQLEQFRAHQMARNDVSLFQTPPQSAPAFQQNFSFNHQGRVVHVPSSHGMGHTRRISLPDAQHEHQVSNQFQPSVHMHGMQPLMQPHFSENFIPDMSALRPSHGLQIQAGCGGDMALRSMAPQSTETGLPIHFHNQTPEDYQKQSRVS